MENASRALLMTAGLLIGIIIVSLGIYLVTISRDFSETYDETISAQKMQEFNAPFIAVSGRKNVSPHEILTLANRANSFNNPDTALAGYYNNGVLKPTDSQYIHIYVKIFHKSVIDLTDKSTYPKYDGKADPDRFLREFLDGSYVYGLDNSLEKYGQYEYDYDNSTGIKKKTYYNCYECTEYKINSKTGRVESMTLVFKSVSHE